METTKKRTVVTVSTNINAPIEKAWKYFNDPKHITRWCFASDDWHAPAAESDFKMGGKSKVRMEAKDGSMGFDFEYTFTNIIENNVVEYVMPDGRRVKALFEKNDNGTKLTESFDAEETNPVEMQRGGWQAILDNFKKYVEQN